MRVITFGTLNIVRTTWLAMMFRLSPSVVDVLRRAGIEEADQRLALEIVPQPPEGFAVPIDDRDLMPVGVHHGGQRGANASAAEDDQLHRVPAIIGGFPAYERPAKGYLPMVAWNRSSTSSAGAETRSRGRSS